MYDLGQSYFLCFVEIAVNLYITGDVIDISLGLIVAVFAILRVYPAEFLARGNFFECDFFVAAVQCQRNAGAGRKGAK